MNNVSKMNTNITVYIIMSSTISSMVASNENQFKQQIKTTDTTVTSRLQATHLKLWPGKLWSVKQSDIVDLELLT